MTIKKILVLNTLYKPYRIGGAERSVELLVEGLKSKGHEVTVICIAEKKLVIKSTNDVTYFRNPNIYWPFDGRSHGAKRIIYHILDSYNLLGFFRVYRTIKKLTPDVLITNNVQGFSSLAWLAGVLKQVPIMHIIRDYSLLSVDPSLTKSNSRATRLFDFFMRWHYKFLLQRVTKIIGISKYVLDKHKRFIQLPDNKCAVLYNPVYIPELLIIQSSKVKNTKTVFGYIGRIADEKGVGWMLDAWENTGISKSSQMIIAGDGPAVNKLKQKHKKNIDFLGKVEPKDFFSKIDILIVPSLWMEPFGRVVIEAYSYGIPVVATDLGGLSEIVYPQHKDELTFCVYDEDNFKSSLIAAIELSKKPELVNELRTYADKFSQANYIDSFEKLISETLMK